ncbi:MAG: hypothetical protein OJF49_002617 [Ktedonobacterales bacterium]|nr:MAG: hypothetical protein OJF49_002617 [Ktedonobacterales bacterium]
MLPPTATATIDPVYHVPSLSIWRAVLRAKQTRCAVSDAYWGDGPDGLGRNMLGLLLMRVREELCA